MKAYNSTESVTRKTEAEYFTWHKFTTGKTRYGRTDTQKRVIRRSKKAARQEGNNTIKDIIND